MNAYPKPEPKPKAQPKRIKPMSAKRLAAEQEKKDAYKSLKETRSKHCQGCGTSQRLSHSHTFGQHRREFIADPRNIYVLCMEGCHQAVESNRFWLLECGEELVGNMLEMDYGAGLARIAKMRERLEGADTEFLPAWVSRVLALLD